MNVTKCQSCDSSHLLHVVSLGYMPPPNDFVALGDPRKPQRWLPTELMVCEECDLVQLQYIAHPTEVFPRSYPYTSGVTKALRDNFADLFRDCMSLRTDWSDKDLVVDVGSNDGTLLSAFAVFKRLGIEPTDTAELANKNGIPTVQKYFSPSVALQVRDTHGPAKLVTMTNCFAHIPQVNAVVEAVKTMLADDGVFVTESHYLMSLLDTLQYDTIYHEHLRYYSLRSLSHLFARHGLEIFRARRIGTHGGSIRVFAARIGQQPIHESVRELLNAEPTSWDLRNLLWRFADEVVSSRWHLWRTLLDLKQGGFTVVGVGAPSRASTVINYCRLDETLIDYICELPGSLKIGKFMPGTKIPVMEESWLLASQPSHAIIFSWHIADEIMKNLRAKGYHGAFILPCARDPSQVELPNNKTETMERSNG